MNFTISSEHEEIVMKLLHYFITDRNYNPVVLHGDKNEIWLENLSGDYKIIRIVSNYIHNDEQLNYDLYRTKQIMKSIRKKTLSLKVPTLSIFLNLGENVHMENEEYDFIKCLNVKELNDVIKNNTILETFADIEKITSYKEEGLDLFVKLTTEINKKTEDDAVKAEDIFKPKKPIVTYILVALNIIIFLLTLTPLENYILYYGVNNRTLVIELNQYHRLLTSCFLHADFFHLFFNCYALYYIGSQIESFYGKGKYLAIYLLSGIIGGLLSICIHDGLSLGASGAIFGLFGALVYFGYHYRLYLGTALRSQIIPVILLNLALGFVIPNIDVSAHLGGLIGGVLVSMACGVPLKSSKSNKINGVVLTLVFIIFMIILLANV